MGGAVKDAPTVVQENDATGRAGSGWKTVLFNCDCHTFDQVERQLMKAVRCSLSQARAFSWEVHSKGSAVVYQGSQERCEAAAGILEDIRLRVMVNQ